MNVLTTLVANGKAAVLVEPGEAALDDPAMAAEPVARVDAAPGDAAGDAALGQRLTAARKVVPLVGVQLVGPAARHAVRLADRRDGVEQVGEAEAVVAVGAAQAQRERRAAAIDDHMMLRAGLAAIGRIRPGGGPPFFGPDAGAVETGAAPVDLARFAQLVEQGAMDRRPHPGRLPVAQPVPAGHARAAAKFLRQPLPRNAGLEHEDDAGQAGAIGQARPPALRLERLRRQQRFDDCPERVSDLGLAHRRSRAGSIPRFC